MGSQHRFLKGGGRGRGGGGVGGGGSSYNFIVNMGGLELGGEQTLSK